MRYKGYEIDIDPYPKKLGDSHLWELLFLKAIDVDERMAEILYWYRSVGAVMINNPKFGFAIKPLIYGKDNCEWGWSSLEEWNNEKKHLVPYAEKVATLLKQIKDELVKGETYV